MFDCLGLDWGEKRSGIAFGDSMTGLVVVLKKEVYTTGLISILKDEVERRKIKKIVLGLPTNFFFQETNITKLIKDFSLELKKTFPEIEIETINERSSTIDAQNKLLKKVDKHTLNHQAAAQILEYYFEKQNLQKIKH